MCDFVHLFCREDASGKHTSAHLVTNEQNHTGKHTSAHLVIKEIIQAHDVVLVLWVIGVGELEELDLVQALVEVVLVVLCSK